LKLPVLVSSQYEKGLGKTIPEIASLLPEQGVHDKLEFSCFANESFRSALQALPQQRKTLLLCGMETHICVLQTALGALAQDYVVHVAADAVGSRSELNWNIGLDRMRAAGAVISSTETILYELLRGSGGAAFKELLPYLKS
jgi:nicotinamidase-related amidase